jgi:hypothetical protein
MAGRISSWEIHFGFTLQWSKIGLIPGPSYLLISGDCQFTLGAFSGLTIPCIVQSHIELQYSMP